MFSPFLATLLPSNKVYYFATTIGFRPLGNKVDTEYVTFNNLFIVGTYVVIINYSDFK